MPVKFCQSTSPSPFFPQRFRLLVKSQDGTCAFEKDLWVQNVLPTVVAPRPDLFRCQPSAHRARRDARHFPQCHQPPRDFRVAPPRKGYTFLSRSATSQRRRLRSYLRGKNAEGLPAAASPRYFSSPPSAVAISEQSGAYTQLPRRFEDCSILDDRRQPRGFETELLSREAPCENSQAFADLVPLQLLTRQCTWALVRASFTSWPKYTAH